MAFRAFSLSLPFNESPTGHIRQQGTFVVCTHVSLFLRQMSLREEIFHFRRLGPNDPAIALFFSFRRSIPSTQKSRGSPAINRDTFSRKIALEMDHKFSNSRLKIGAWRSINFCCHLTHRLEVSRSISDSRLWQVLDTVCKECDGQPRGSRRAFRAALRLVRADSVPMH